MRGFINPLVASSKINLKNGSSLMELLGNRILIDLVLKKRIAQVWKIGSINIIDV